MAAVAWLGCATPLAAHTLVPATDLPHHLALSAVLWRLGQGAAEATYAANLQPTPYHLAYVLLVPLVGLCGPFAAARLFFVALATALVAALAACRRAFDGPPATVLAAPLVLYGACFYYGFVATLAGLPCLLVALWGAQRHAAGGGPGPLRLACVAAAAATVAHAVLAWPGALVGAALMAVRRRGGAALAAAATAPLLPALLLTAPGHGRLPRAFEPAGPTLQWGYFTGFLGPFDHGMGRLAHVLALAVLLALAWAGRRRLPPTPRLPLALVGAALCLSFVVSPRQFASGASQAWGMSFRFLTVAELILVATLPGGHGAPRLQRLGSAALGLCVLLHGAAQWRAWDAFERRARPPLAALAALPRGARLAVDKRRGVALPHAWAPALSHLEQYHLATGGGCVEALFCGGHLPLKARRPCGAAVADFLWQQGEPLPPPPPGSQTLFDGPPWRLLALPRRS